MNSRTYVEDMRGEWKITVDQDHLFRVQFGEEVILEIYGDVLVDVARRNEQWTVVILQTEAVWMKREVKFNRACRDGAIDSALAALRTIGRGFGGVVRIQANHLFFAKKLPQKLIMETLNIDAPTLMALVHEVWFDNA